MLTRRPARQVDGGKAKEKTYDALNQLSCLLPAWVSQVAPRAECIVPFFPAGRSALHYPTENREGAIVAHRRVT